MSATEAVHQAPRRRARQRRERPRQVRRLPRAQRQTARGRSETPEGWQISRRPLQPRPRGTGSYTTPGQGQPGRAQRAPVRGLGGWKSPGTARRRSASLALQLDRGSTCVSPSSDTYFFPVSPTTTRNGRATEGADNSGDWPQGQPVRSTHPRQPRRSRSALSSCVALRSQVRPGFTEASANSMVSPYISRPSEAGWCFT
jgi:hypothetical protein